MLFSQKTIAAVAALMLTVPSATGHIILKTPKPFKFDGDGESNPVSRDGSDFPCRVKAYTVDGERTQMPIGSKQAATFSGSAVHCGCFADGANNGVVKFQSRLHYGSTNSTLFHR